MSEKITVKIEKQPKSEVKITVTIAAEEFEKFIDQATEDLSKNLKVDGFRSGKIPKDVVERQVGSDAILHEGAEKAVRKTYVDAVLESKIEAIGQPKVEIKKIARGNDLEYVATVAIMPEVVVKDWKGEISKINQEQTKKAGELTVKDEEVDRELEYLAKQRVKIVTVSREVAKGDQVEIDFEVLRGGVPIEHGTAKKHPLVIGEGKFIPGFEDHLVGTKAGDEKVFDLEFPKDYHEKTLAGQKATFKVKVNLVQERQVPKINDEFASSIGKFKNLEELRNNIKEGIAHEQKHKLQDEHRRKLLDVLISKVEAEIPEILVNIELERMLGELENEISMIGLNKQAYFDQMKTSEETLKNQWRENQAPDRVKAALALRQLAKEQEISPLSTEIEERMNKYLQYYKTMGDINKDVDMERLYDMVKGNLTNEKVLDFLSKQ